MVYSDQIIKIQYFSFNLILQEWQFDIINHNEKIFRVYRPWQPKHKILSRQFSHAETMALYLAPPCKKKMVTASCCKKVVCEFHWKENHLCYKKQAKASKEHSFFEIIVVFWRGFDGFILKIYFKIIQSANTYNSYYRNTAYMID